MTGAPGTSVVEEIVVSCKTRLKYVQIEANIWNTDHVYAIVDFVAPIFPYQVSTSTTLHPLPFIHFLLRMFAVSVTNFQILFQVTYDSR